MRRAIAPIGALVLLALALPAAAQETDQCRLGVNDDRTAAPSAGCEAMLAAAPDDRARAELLFRMAYAYNEQQQAVAALALLDRGLALAPGNPQFLGERGFTRADLGYYDLALADLEAALQALPDNPELLSERAFVRRTLGDFAGALADMERTAQLGSNEPGHHAARAGDLLWLDRLDEAEAQLAAVGDNAEWAESVAASRAQIARRRAYVVDGTEAETCDLGDNLTDVVAAERLVDQCTQAFMATSDPVRRADFLTTRSSALQVARNSAQAGYRDMQLAAALDPANPNRHFNFAFALMQVSRSWAARNAFDAALTGDGLNPQARAIALGGRAQANYNLGDRAAAMRDVSASFELEPNEPALWVASSLMLDAGDRDAARDMAVLVYSLGGRSDALMARLRELGVDDPDAAAAASRAGEPL